MATSTEHYDNHLGRVYSWMIGDFNGLQQEQEALFRRLQLLPSSAGKAFDLGAGNGIQSVSLARLGFSVMALDLNHQLLSELRENIEGFPVTVIKDDLLNISAYAHHTPELVVCCGDTITHLPSFEYIEQLIQDTYNTLAPGGKLLLTFRDYSVELKGDARFIPVRSDKAQIATCFLEYFSDRVVVTDILHKHIDGKWIQQVSSYAKVRVSRETILSALLKVGYVISFNDIVNRMITIIADKKE